MPGPGLSLSRYARQKLNRQVVLLCSIIFMADLLSGIISPTFSLYARGLGISLALLGLMNTSAGLVRLLASLPLGMFSDRVGRTRLMAAGMAIFGLSMLFLTFAAGPTFLFAGRILFGLGAVAVFQIGAARLGDVTTPEQRPFAFGLFATAMGMGFTLGSVLGGQLADRFGAETAYLIGATIAALGFLIGMQMLGDHPASRRVASDAPEPPAPADLTVKRSGLREVLISRPLMLVSFGNLLISLTFNGAVLTFFPIYGTEMLLTQAAIGTMFSIRGLVSALGRIPNGIVARLLGAQSVMSAALVLEAIAMFGIARTTDATLLTVLLAGDGLAFGAFLVSSQTYVADNTALENRGAAVGVYATASSLGAVIAPLLLGIVAEQWSVRSVFTITAWTMTIGLIVFIAGTVTLGRDRARAHRTEIAES